MLSIDENGVLQSREKTMNTLCQNAQRDLYLNTYLNED